MSLGDRITAMADRLAREAIRAGISDNDADRVRRIFIDVAEARASRLDSREHTDVLHTARTALILLEDADAPDLLAPAVALDTRDPHLMPGLDGLPLDAHERALIDEVIAAVSSDIALEELLAAELPVRLLAVSEALDHARHLHLRPTSGWRDCHDRACTVFLPIASRTHPALARRFDWWCNMFRNRYLRP